MQKEKGFAARYDTDGGTHFVHIRCEELLSGQVELMGKLLAR